MGTVSRLRAATNGLALLACAAVQPALAAPDLQNPAVVPQVQAIKVVAGAAHTLALRADGTVFTWGSNSAGQLGDGTTLERSSAAPVPAMAGVIDVAAGGNVSLALKGDGTVWSWGRFESASGMEDIRTAPQPVSSLTGVTKVAVSATHALVLRNDGSVWAWGLNEYGEVGDGTKSARAAPVQVLAGAVHIAAGERSSLAMRSDATLRVWGSNASGALGLGSGVAEALRPTALSTSADSPPANDNFADAIMLSGTSGSVSASLLRATREAGEPAEGGSASSVSIWYRWVAPVAGQVTLATTGAAGVGAEAYIGPSVASLAWVGGATWQAQGGQEYRIVVYGPGTTAGAVGLSWSSAGGTPSADVSIGVVARPSTAVVGARVVYDIDVANAGPSVAVGTSVTAPLPPDTQLDTATLPAGCAAAGTNLVCMLGTLNPGDRASFSVALRPTRAPQTIVWTFSITSSIADPVPANNSAGTSVAVSASGPPSDAGDIPTAPEWALIVLAALLMGLSLRPRRR